MPQINETVFDPELEAARKFFAGDLYATRATGIVIDAVGENSARCSLRLDERHKNAVGQVMGGVMFTLADFVFAVSTNRGASPTVTVTSVISYLNPVKGSSLTASSRLVKDGKRTCFYQIDISDDLGTPVAVVSVTGAHLAG